jgi:predicted 3-demethylubiquinone-9 3-methyltransferase (glyoxalase superfamily)
VPSLLFTGAVAGKAEEAMDFYVSVFPDSKKGIIARYGAGREPDKEGTAMYEDFALSGQWFAAMDSAHPHGFAFNEAISLMVSCDTQEEIDSFWEKLSAVPEAEQCGWCKDRYGLSWQIVPRRLGELMSGTPERRARVMKAFLGMKKFDIAELERAYAG